jgi:hypothetical protein
MSEIPEIVRDESISIQTQARRIVDVAKREDGTFKKKFEAAMK